MTRDHTTYCVSSNSILGSPAECHSDPPDHLKNQHVLSPEVVGPIQTDPYPSAAAPGALPVTRASQRFDPYVKSRSLTALRQECLTDSQFCCTPPCPPGA
jgi:hypothetical protein